MKKHRCNSRIKSSVHMLTFSKKFDIHSQSLCILHIFCCDLCNTFGINFFKIHVFSWDDRCKDRDLPACILSFHISSRICLCKSILLCFTENLFIVRSLVEHPGHHVIGCSVQDSCDFFDLITCQGWSKCPEDWNPPSHTCFKKEIHILFPCCFKECGSMLGNQRLIGCHNTFSCFQCFSDKGIRRFHTAHHFYYNSNLRIIQDNLIIMNNLFLDLISREIPQIQHIFYFNFFTCICSN